MILPADLAKLQQTLEATPPELRLTVLKALLSPLSDKGDREVLETMFLLGSQSTASQQRDHVVVLIHGIRTHATWQERLVQRLSDECGITAIPIGYGYLDVFKFLFPFFTRNGPIKRILRELRTIRARTPNSDISIVAHSFGTYILAEILNEETDVRLHRVQLCGSIIKTHYRWDKVIDRVTGAVVNDAGTKDVWPVFAKLASWGYGPSGTFGFKSAVVTDRFYNCGHSDFFNDEHMAKFWLPLMVDGQVVRSKWNVTRPSPGKIVTLLNVFPLKTVILFVLVWLVMRIGRVPTVF